MPLQGIPLVHEMNELRNTLFYNSHYDTTNSPIEAFGFWTAHKGLTVVAVPVNAVAIGVSALGLSVGVALGLVKVAAYALTVGHFKPEFSTGFIRSGEATLHSAAEIAWNGGELLYDAGNILYNGYKIIRWVTEQLPLGLVKAAFIQIARLAQRVWNSVFIPVFEFVGRRIEIGFSTTLRREENYRFDLQTPALLQPLNELTKETRYEWGSNERSFTNIFEHYLYSIPNLTCNTLAAAGLGTASAVSGTFFVAKAIICATTTLDIPIPTYAPMAIGKTIACAGNILKDTATNVVDIFVTTYKVSCAIRVDRVIVGLWDIVSFIPRAIIS